MSYISNILSKMQSTPSFNPGSVTTFGDPTVDAGDVITVQKSGEGYSFPVFSQSFTWNGAGKATLTAEGNEERKVQDAKDRDLYDTESAIASASSSAKSASSAAANVKQSAHEELLAEIDKAKTGITADAKEYTDGRIESVTKIINEVKGDVASVSATLENSVTMDEVNDRITARLGGTLTVKDLDGYISKADFGASYYEDGVKSILSNGNYISSSDGTLEAAMEVVKIKDKAHDKEKTMANVLADQIELNDSLYIGSGGRVYVQYGVEGNDDDLAMSVTGGVSITGDLNLSSGSKIYIGGTELNLSGSSSSTTTGTLDTSKYAETQMKVVTSFTQASGESAKTQTYTLYLTDTGTTTRYTPAMGAGVIWG